jgi:hypothetical protein
MKTNEERIKKNLQLRLQNNEKIKKKKKKNTKKTFPLSSREHGKSISQQYQKQKNKIGSTQVSTNKKIKKRLNCSVPTSVLFGWLVYQVLVSK